MAFLNKKAVEALPLRYIIIALVAALVVGIALQMTGTLRGGIQGTAEKLNASVTEKVACELDEEDPVISNEGTTCANDTLNLKVDMVDDCGVNAEAVGFFTNATGNTDYYPTLSSGTINDGRWTYTGDDNGWDDKTISISVWANDKAGMPNKATYTFSVTCG